MKHTLNKNTLLLTFSLSLSSNLYATGIPTVDIANIIQTTSTALEQFQQTANQAEQIANQVQQIQNQVEQLTKLDEQFEAMTGNYGLGQLLNSEAEKNLRRFVPTSWQDTLAIMESGAMPGHQSQVQDAIRAAQQNGERYSAAEIFQSINTDEAVEYVKQANKIFTSMGISQSAYSATEQRYEHIEQLTDQIDTATDLKASQDLQNRILTESTAYLNELIRQVSVMNIQSSEQREQQHNQNADDRRSSNATLNYDW